MRVMPVFFSVLLLGCATQHKPGISTAPSFTGAKHSVEQSSKNVVGVQGHLSRTKQLADEADYKLMKAEGR